MPVGGAHFTVEVSILEGLHHSQVLIGVPADGQVVYRSVSHDSLDVDDVGGSKGNTVVILVLAQASEGPGDLLVQVGNQGDVHGAEASFLLGLEGVLHVRELGVDGAGEQFAADFLELLGLVVEGDDFSGADEGEVEGVEEEADVLAPVGAEINLDEVAVVPGIGDKDGSGLSDE